MPTRKKSKLTKSGAAAAEWQQHVARLHAIEKKLPDHLRTGLDPKSIRTAAKAKQYIKRAKALQRKVRIIEVPRPAEGSFNKNRPMPTLLRTQVEHFQSMEKSLPGKLTLRAPMSNPQTENEAADYIRKMTAMLHNTEPVRKRKR